MFERVMKGRFRSVGVSAVWLALSLSSSSVLCTSLFDGSTERSFFQAPSVAFGNHALTTPRSSHSNGQLSKQNRTRYPSSHTAVTPGSVSLASPSTWLRLPFTTDTPLYFSFSFTRFQGRAPPISA